MRGVRFGAGFSHWVGCRPAASTWFASYSVRGILCFRGSDVLTIAHRHSLCKRYFVTMGNLKTAAPKLAPAAPRLLQQTDPSAWHHGNTSSTARGYGYRWQQERGAYLRLHPLCVMHRDGGRTVPATVVDHITPHRGDPLLFWDRTNWQSLCKPCHDGRKQAQEKAADRADPRPWLLPAPVATGPKR